MWSGVARGCSHSAPHNGCSSSSHSGGHHIPDSFRYAPEPEPPHRPIVHEEEPPTHLFVDEAAQQLAKQPETSDWNELPGETIDKSILHTRTDITVPEDAFLKTVTNPHLLIAMPTNGTQYKTIYRKDSVSYSAEQELAKFSKEVLNTQNASSIDGGLSHVYASIDASEDDFVVVFAHSKDNGRTLVLPNGDKVSDLEIHEHCANQLKVCVVLTCHGDDFEILDRITADEGLAMWNAAIAKHMEGDMSIQHFIYQMRLKRNSMKREKKIKMFLSASGTLSTTIYYYSSEDE